MQTYFRASPAPVVCTRQIVKITAGRARESRPVLVEHCSILTELAEKRGFQRMNRAARVLVSWFHLP
jgi:hypothetical protein